jgi:hypothetical protein
MLPHVNQAGPIPTNKLSRILASIDGWKRKLLDLSKRNRLLNFKPTKVSTVVIVDEQPAEVFRHLHLQGRTMKFKPVAGRSEPSQPSASTDLLEREEESTTAVLYVPYERESLDSRHVDDVLQTAATPEQLDRSLRRLDELARSTIEEQGVNTLFLAMGMLHYKESKDSEQIMRAPLILLPVQLTRGSARAGYVLKTGDEDPLLNPALVEYLRRSFGIETPKLPESDAMSEDYDLQAFFAAFHKRIASLEGWALTTDIVLGQFSFQKFVMYKDLEAHGDRLGIHRLIQQIATRSGETFLGLPDEIRTMALDREFAPEETFQVVDADSSQLRALAAVNRGYDMVMEGPPGTGKSQTITNLIAQALAAGKTVLFVAEKMAALQVVRSRLQAAGLGDFCLELHSTKANKRIAMQEIKKALDASLEGLGVPIASTRRLPEVRLHLGEYVQAVHTPYGTLAISPYAAYGELGKVLDAPRLRLERPIDDVTQSVLGQAVRDLEDLARTAEAIGRPAEHPWRDCSRTFLSEDDLHGIEEIARQLVAQLNEVTVRAKRTEEILGLPTVNTLADIKTVIAVAGVLARSPGAPLAVLQNDVWNAPPPEALALVERGRQISRLKDEAQERFTQLVLEMEHEADITYVEKKSEAP